MSQHDAELAGNFFAGVFAATGDRAEALAVAYNQLDAAGLISKVRVHEYRCRNRRGCSRGTVIRAGAHLILRASAYHLAPAKNAAESVEASRKTNTLDGARHWKSRTIDVTENDGFEVELRCRHGKNMVVIADLIELCAGVVPGHPGAPTLA